MNRRPEKGQPLTAAELRVYDLLVEEGLLDKVIADKLNLTESTVKCHVASIRDKLGVRHKLQIVVTHYKRQLSLQRSAA